MTEEQALPPDEQAAIDERNRVARESIEKARALWMRRQVSLRPLPRTGALEALHAGMRERVATSIFGRDIHVPQGYGFQYIDDWHCIPSLRVVPQLSDIALAALITFLRRGERARAGILVSDGKSLAEASNDPV